MTPNGSASRGEGAATTARPARRRRRRPSCRSRARAPWLYPDGSWRSRAASAPPRANPNSPTTSRGVDGGYLLTVTSMIVTIGWKSESKGGRRHERTGTRSRSRGPEVVGAGSHDARRPRRRARRDRAQRGPPHPGHAAARDGIRPAVVLLRVPLGPGGPHAPDRKS